jgi:hypothetical protein
MATPRYLVLTPTFIQPEPLLAGDIIATDSTPGEHLKPLNKEAKAKMEAWYEEELTYTVYDKDTGLPSQHKCWPHRKYRIQTSEPGQAQTVQVLKRAKTLNEPESSVGFSFLKPSTDQRPGPEMSQDVDLSDLPDEDIDEELDTQGRLPLDDVSIVKGMPRKSQIAQRP